MTAMLEPAPLTADAFAPFGQVIAPDEGDSYPINGGLTRRVHALATPEMHGGAAVISIFRGTRWPQPLRIQMLERHPYGTQALIPMERHPWLVVVAEQPKPEACRAFLARGDQGIQLAAGIWHHPLLVFQPLHDFLVVDRSQPEGNLEEVHFDPGTGPELAPV